MVFWSSFLFVEYQIAVRKSFVYLRKHLTFESLRDKLVEKNLLSDRERDDYVCMIPIEYAMIGKVIKLMIKKGRCKEFVDIIDNLPDHRHVMNKINAARQHANNPGQENHTRCKIFAINFILASLLSVNIWTTVSFTLFDRLLF